MPPAELQVLGIKRIPLIRIDGETLVERAIRCCLEAGCAGVAVIAPDEVPLPESADVRRLSYSGDPVRDFCNAVEALPQDALMLVSSTDMPHLSPQAVREVAETGMKHGADLLYPVCPRSVIEAKYPDTKRTYLRLRDGEVSGCNMFCINPRWISEKRSAFEKLFAMRKNKLALARWFGPVFLIRIATGMAGLGYLEEQVGRRLGGTMKAYRSQFAELAVDLDKLEDLELFRSELDPWGQG